MSGGRLLARNAIVNLLGQGAPLLVAVFAIPVLTRQLGSARFGLLTLAWVVLGYFSLFDLGLGRAMTKVVAERLGLGQEDTVPAVVWTTLALMLALGVVGSIVSLAISPWLVFHALKIPNPLKPESLQTFYLLAVAIPLVTSTAGLRGVLEAKQRFDLVNAVRVPLGVLTFLGPLAVLPFTHSLVPIVAVLLFTRALAWIAHLVLCVRVLPALRARGLLQLAVVRPLLEFGTWISVSNVVGPLMVTLDRFVIGAMISVSAVAYYTAPYEAVTKLWMIPGALTGVLFPAFATTLSYGRARAASLYRIALKFTFLILFPITLVIMSLAREGLDLWLGLEYAQRSTRVLQWLAVGVFVNSLGQVPFALIQGGGRPDLTAKLHLIELPFYLLGLWWLISFVGIEGAAIAWAARCLVDTSVLLGIARRLLPPRPLPLGRMTLGSAAVICTLTTGTLPMGLITKALFLIGIISLFSLVGWFAALAPEERRHMGTLVSSRR